MKDELPRSDVTLNILNKTIEIFTSHLEKSFEEVMASGLRPLIEELDLERVSIYHRLKNDTEHFGQFYRWHKPSGGTTPPDKFLEVLPLVPGVKQWLGLLTKGECVIRKLSEMSKDEADFSNMIDIKTIVVAPIFTHEELWGFVAFQYLTKERDLGEYRDLLNSIARLCANAAIREDMRQKNEETIKKLKQRETILETLSKTAITFVSQNEESFDKKMTEGLRFICDVVNLDRASIFRNSRPADGLLHTSQIYRWDRKAGGTTKPLPALKDVKFVEIVPRWEKILESNEIANGPARLMPEAEMLQSFGVVSALVVPIFIKNSLWGFGFFEDLKSERYFEEVHIEIMRSVAFLCTNLVIRSEMEREIAETIKLNDALVNAAPISIAICDEQANMIDCNATALKMFDCSKEYFLSNFDKLYPEYQLSGLKSKDIIDMILNKSSSGGKHTFEWIHLTSSGEQIPCEITVTWADYKGAIIGLCYIYDLRNIKKMEAVADEAKEMTRAIAEASPVSYILFDNNLQIVDCNETAVQVLKSPSKQYLLDNYWRVFATEEQPDGQGSYEKSRVVLNKALKDGKHSFEWTQRTIDGEDVPMENTLYPLIFKDRKFVISFKYDLRKYKSLMDSISKQNEMLTFRLELQKFISEISKDFISCADLYTIMNEAIGKVGKKLNASRILVIAMDYENQDVYPTYQWYTDDSIPRMTSNRSFSLFNIVKSTFPKHLPEGTVIPTFACADVNAGPEPIRVLSSVSTLSFISIPLYVEDNLWGIIDVENCVKPHKWSEDEVVFFTMISSIVSGAIMRNIYDTRLKETLNKVLRMSKEKDDFLSKVSHEIRTPMNAILGITEIQLQDETLPLKVRENLGTIYNSGDSLLRIVNDLLDLSKIEAGKLEIIIARYEIASLINDTVQLNMRRIESKPIEFKLKIDENIPSEFFGDELRIKQILNNILSNAFKYTDSGTITMTVSAKWDKEKKSENVMLIFTVTDTGHGMSVAQAHNIFNKYSRLNSRTNHMIEGTGLGMNITQNLVHLMNGEISVKSELGKGSTFTVHLPQTSAVDTVLGEETTKNLQSFRISSSSQIKRTKVVREAMPYGSVLVVDDVESNLYVAKQLLMPYELSIETVTNGFDALDKIKSGKIYDIIFMDHMMPKMDGMETVRQIRNMGYAHPIIALTANAVAGQSSIFLKNGFDGFISKPIDTHQLNIELNKFIRDKQPSEVIAEIHKQAIEERKYTQIMHKADVALHHIFARDAKKALAVFEHTLKNLSKASNDDLRKFAISAHAMKGALANIGESAYSQLAFTLEMAGKKEDKATIESKTHGLIEFLKITVEKIEREAERKPSGTDEDTTYLYEQLKTISNACANYDEKTATATLANLEQKHWTKKTGNVFNQIEESLLHSDFEKAGKIANDYCNTIK